jgi:hypothetical protein
MDASWKFLILTAWLSGAGLEMLIGMTAGLEERIEISNRFNTFNDSLLSCRLTL